MRVGGAEARLRDRCERRVVVVQQGLGEREVGDGAHRQRLVLGQLAQALARARDRVARRLVLARRRAVHGDLGPAVRHAVVVEQIRHAGREQVVGVLEAAVPRGAQRLRGQESFADHRRQQHLHLAELAVQPLERRDVAGVDLDRVRVQDRVQSQSRVAGLAARLFQPAQRLARRGDVVLVQHRDVEQHAQRARREVEQERLVGARQRALGQALRRGPVAFVQRDVRGLVQHARAQRVVVDAGQPHQRAARGLARALHAVRLDVGGPEQRPQRGVRVGTRARLRARRFFFQQLDHVVAAAANEVHPVADHDLAPLVVARAADRHLEPRLGDVEALVERGQRGFQRERDRVLRQHALVERGERLRDGGDLALVERLEAAAVEPGRHALAVAGAHAQRDRFAPPSDALQRAGGAVEHARAVLLRQPFEARGDALAARLVERVRRVVERVDELALREVLGEVAVALERGQDALVEPADRRGLEDAVALVARAARERGHARPSSRSCSRRRDSSRWRSRGVPAALRGACDWFVRTARLPPAPAAAYVQAGGHLAGALRTRPDEIPRFGVHS